MLREMLKRVPFARTAGKPIRRVQRAIRDRRESALAMQEFANADVLLRAMKEKGRPELIETFDGLKIHIRPNLWDAIIVHEMFVQKPYLKHVTMPPGATVIDIGGYIGDFVLYCAHKLKARKIVVLEPTAENFAMLEQNVRENELSDRVVAVNKAVSSQPEIVVNVETAEGGEIHVSSFRYKGATQRRIPATTLAAIMDDHKLPLVDMVKIDCEGAEYGILDSTPDSALVRINHLVVEFHPIDGYEGRLAFILKRLQGLGFGVRKDGMIYSASRGLSIPQRTDAKKLALLRT